MDMPFAFDDKLAFNLPEGYRGVWESDESEEDDDNDDIEPIEWKEPVCKIVLSDYERSKQGYQFSCSSGEAPHRKNRAFRLTAETLCFHFGDSPKPLLFLRWMLKVAD